MIDRTCQKCWGVKFVMVHLPTGNVYRLKDNRLVGLHGGVPQIKAHPWEWTTLMCDCHPGKTEDRIKFFSGQDILRIANGEIEFISVIDRERMRKKWFTIVDRLGPPEEYYLAGKNGN